MKTSRLIRFTVIAMLSVFFFGGLGLTRERIARGVEPPDYSWILKTPLQKHLSGTMLSYLLRIYGPKKIEKERHAESTLPVSVNPASELSDGKKLVNDPSLDVVDNSTQSEASLAVDGDRIVIAWNDAGDFFKNGQFTGYGYSHDGGKSFVDRGPLMGPSNGTSLGDPIVAVDKSGSFYISTLAVDKDFFSIVGFYKSTDGGVTFSSPVNVSGTNPRDLPDKEFMAIDTTESSHAGNIYVTWTNFVFFGQFAQITFARSTDGGKTFAAPIPLSAQLANPVQGSSISIGPDGEVYVTWEDLRTPNSIRMRKSPDGGKTFEPEMIVSTLTPIGDPEASSDCDEPALKGFIRVNDFPSSAVDRSQGAYRGAVYVTYNADPDEAEEGDTSDIFLVRSTDGGQSWSLPVRVNNDQTENDQFMPFVAIADDGTVSVIWYDRRIDPENFRIDLFRAISTDGGQTFANERVTPESFGIPQLLPNFNPFVSDCYMGDYNWMTAQEKKFYLAWGDNLRLQATPDFPEGRPDPDIVFSIESTQISTAPVLAAGPQILDFESVDVGDSDERKLILQNIGSSVLTGTLRISGAPFRLAGSESAIEREQAFALSFNLNAGEVFEVPVEFVPTEEGFVSGKIQIESNDAQHPSVEISLRGQGVASADGPAIRVAPKELDFGEVLTGRVKQVTLTIRNVGTEPLMVKKILSNRPSIFRATGIKGGQTIRPGRQLRVRINGRAAANSLFRARLSIISNDPAEPKLIVPVALRGVRARSADALAKSQRARDEKQQLSISERTLHINLVETSAPSARVELYDMSGRLAFSRQIEGRMLSVPLLNAAGVELARGVYLGLVRWRGSAAGFVQRVILE